MHTKQFITANKALGEGQRVLVMIHGRGGTAEDILSLAPELDVRDFTWIAPKAMNNTWYPYSFMAPQAQNEPWLSSAISALDDVIKEIKASGIPQQSIFFLGFSQGACLTLEYVTRNAGKWGGVVAFTGGLIGDKIQPDNYKGDFGGTPVFIGTSNPDPHVPVERVYATANIMRDMNANVTEKVYLNMGHTINRDEIDQANKLVFNSTTVQ